MGAFHFSVSKTSDVPNLLDDLNNKFKRRNLVSMDTPTNMMGNHKQISLKDFCGNIIRISGPKEIIEDLFFVYFK